MSAEALALVLNHSGRSGTDQLVLVGIANHDGDGGAWPAVSTLARYAGVDPRSVQRSIVRLAQAGIIRVDVQGGGGRDLADHRRPNRYTLLLRCPPDCDGSRSHRTKRSPGALQTALPLDGVEVEDLSTGVTPVSPVPLTPVSPVPLTPVSPERSLEPPLEEHPVGTDRNQRLGPVETVDNAPAATPARAAEALAEIRATLARSHDDEATG